MGLGAFTGVSRKPKVTSVLIWGFAGEVAIRDST
jgi:hypothetical protein